MSHRPEEESADRRGGHTRNLESRTRYPVRQHVPPRVQTFGMVVFLLTLTMLFGATMVLFVVLRTRAQDQYPPGALRHAVTNFKLYTSTAIVLAASFTIHMALLRVRRQRHAPFIRWLIVTDLLALAFLAVQTPAMIGLLRAQPAIPLETPTLAAGGIPVTQLYKLLFILVLLHAAHVAGGVIYFAAVTRRALTGYYDHEYYTGVRNAAMYWHFLDLVWMTMFGMFLYFG